MLDASEPKPETRLTVEEAHEDINRVSKAFNEPKWWENLTRNQKDADFIFDLAREYGYEDVKPENGEALESFCRQLESGYYLGILETYPVNWSAEKIGRDLWQNFFDGNGHTVDGLTFSADAQGGG